MSPYCQKVSKNLILKLDMSKQILEQAANTIHNSKLSNDLKRLAIVRKDFQKNLASITGLNMKQLALPVNDRLKVEAVKIGMEIDDLYLKDNEREILGFCDEQIDILSDEYQKAIGSEMLSEFLISEIERQNETIQHNRELIHKEYELLL